MTNTTKLSKVFQSQIRKAFPGASAASFRKDVRANIDCDAPVDALRSLAATMYGPAVASLVALADDVAAYLAKEARIERDRQEARDAIAANRCPVCARPVRRNLSLTGWIQCNQYGADTHRADASQPACSWQGFTC